jgi:hypothetical protein
VARFKALAARRKTGLLKPDEEAEYRTLGQGFAAQKRAAVRRRIGLKGRPLPGCDFFDDFPELYRQGLIHTGTEVPGPAGDSTLPGAVLSRGQVVLADGRRLSGQILWAPEPSCDGTPFDRATAQAVFLAASGGALPGSGRALTTTDGRVIHGYLASDLDPLFVDLIPADGVPAGVERLIMRKDRLTKVEPWQPA